MLNSYLRQYPQVKIHYEAEQAFEEEKQTMNDGKKDLIARQTKELENFRYEAEVKLSNQQGILKKLLDEKTSIERETRETIAQMEEDVDIMITKTQERIDADAAQQRSISSQLGLENGILTRRLSSSLKNIEDAKEKVKLMLDQTAKTQSKVRIFIVLVRNSAERF